MRWRKMGGKRLKSPNVVEVSERGEGNGMDWRISGGKEEGEVDKTMKTDSDRKGSKMGGGIVRERNTVERNDGGRMGCIDRLPW